MGLAGWVELTYLQNDILLNWSNQVLIQHGVKD